jgi:hypothetical protein
MPALCNVSLPRPSARHEPMLCRISIVAYPRRFHALPRAPGRYAIRSASHVTRAAVKPPSHRAAARDRREAACCVIASDSCVPAAATGKTPLQPRFPSSPTSPISHKLLRHAVVTQRNVGGSRDLLHTSRASPAFIFVWFKEAASINLTTHRTMKKSNSIIAVAGEYFVAAELSKLGHVALITLRNTENVDILASNLSGTRSVSIQVKTQSGNGRGWPLNQKHETISSPTLFYVFVTLRGPGERPEFYIVPSSVVSNRIRTNHSEWLKVPARDGSPHVDSPMRKFDEYSDYKDKWDILGL